jgi:predicted DNA-binding transcriptional regulator AlpA
VPGKTTQEATMTRQHLTDRAAPHRILRQREAAAYVGLSESKLAKFRWAGGGPPFIRLGGRAVGYCLDDLDLWIERHRVASTGEVAR